MQTLRVLGKDLKVGDHLHTWWNTTDRGGMPHRDIIKNISPPYTGRLGYIWRDGAYFAFFVYNRTGMTIDNAGYYTVDREVM